MLPREQDLIAAAVFDTMNGSPGVVEHPEAATSQPFPWEGKSAMHPNPTVRPLKRQANCKQCGKTFNPRRANPGVYCSLDCKSAWQRTQKPVTRDWLYEKYVIEGLSAPAIASIVGRDSKRVWEWLRDFGIPTRPRGSDPTNWRKPGEPSSFLGRKHSEETRKKLSEMAKADGRVPYDPAIGSYMKGRRGPQVPSWKGGVTPERQAFYGTPEWKAVVPVIWKRDNATCQRCGKRSSKGHRYAFDIHHIVSFQYRELRAEPSNLVLLCEECHYWVHSSSNDKRLFIKEIENAAG